MKKRWIKKIKTLHKWPAIIISLFVILFAVSGIIMNHRDFVSTVDISRKFMPKNYRYKNWNLSAIRGSLQISENRILIYGNIGIWKSDANFQEFSDFNQGLPKGIDNRKIYSIVKFKNRYFAATHFGLFCREYKGASWQPVKLPVSEQRIADLNIKGDTLLVLTRHHLLKSTEENIFEIIQIPAPIDYQHKTGLFETLWQMHSGELFGLTGKLIVDLLGLAAILLSLTGLLHFFFPKIINRRKKTQKHFRFIILLKKKNLRWHNIVGYIFALFLIINTVSGMHLRPPLLIAIAGKQVGIIPDTHLDSPNPWFDKFRRVIWDEESHRFIFSTSEGFYLAEESLKQPLRSAFPQPPVSVMGCNVLKPLGRGNYLIGSFSGMFIWNTMTGSVIDFFNRQPYVKPNGMVKPISDYMITGLAEGKNNTFWFDYNKGAQGISSFGLTPTFPKMPEELREASPISLWNVALELHTGRIFENIIGSYYILYVPFAGICILLVLISGVVLWWKLHRKKKRQS